ncbi:hypothetical protein BDF14DRAFT_1741927 [Spinellus fusiger]|nr:hypothetical protein BDF14DRAFT_1741927 [Spinellus fusiger]
MSDTVAATREQINAKIRKQFNFYFGDSNLPYDKYLWNLTNNTGVAWVPIKTIASFKKMKSICEDYDQIVEALKEVPSDLLEVDEAGQNIKRKTVPVEADHMSRSVYVKGFPLVDADASSNTESINLLTVLHDEIEELFLSGGEVLAIRLKKTTEKQQRFKGSAYIEFASSDIINSVVQKEWEFKGEKLTVIKKSEYHDLKTEEYKKKPTIRKKRVRLFNAFRPQLDLKYSTGNKRKGSDKWEPHNKKAAVEKKGEVEASPVVEKESVVEASSVEEKAVTETENKPEAEQ